MNLIFGRNELKNTNHIVVALTYFLLVVVCEIALYYLVRALPSTADFVMPGTILLFVVLAWYLKPTLLSLVIVSILVMLYGALSFYSDFPVYHLGYPETIEEFLPDIGIKTGFYTFPLVAYVLLRKKDGHSKT